MDSTINQNAAEASIRALAERFKVVYRETAASVLGHHFMRLSGDDVALDEPALLLLALRRAGHVASAEAAHLHGLYLRAKYE